MELLRALAVLAEVPGPEQVRLGRLLGLPGGPDPSQHTDLFVLQLYPYASVYLGAQGMLGGEARDRIAGFWRALKRTPPPEPDHLTVLLALYASLEDSEGAETDPARKALTGQSRKALLWEHLASWLFPYLDKVEEIASPFYRSWGRLLREALTAETCDAGPPDRLPLHLRRAPALPDPGAAGPDEVLRSLLSPVRSGIIVTRADLARAARGAGLALRLGERRFVLAALLSQDADRTLGWLAAEARDWSQRHLRHGEAADGVARYWAGRAQAAAVLLEELRASATQGIPSRG